MEQIEYKFHCDNLKYGLCT